MRIFLANAGRGSQQLTYAVGSEIIFVDENFECVHLDGKYAFDMHNTPPSSIVYYTPFVMLLMFQGFIRMPRILQHLFVLHNIA